MSEPYTNEVESIKRLIQAKQEQESARFAKEQAWSNQAGCDATPRRENVLNVIDQRLSDLRLELNQLDALRRQLPQEMNLPAQEALINLIRRQSR